MSTQQRKRTAPAPENTNRHRETPPPADAPAASGAPTLLQSPAPLSRVGLEGWTQLSRRQSQWAVQGMVDLYQGAELLRELQRDTAQASREAHREALTAQIEARDLTQLLSVHVGLMSHTATAWATYWQRLLGVAMRTEAAIVKDVGTALATNQGERLRSVASLFPGFGQVSMEDGSAGAGTAGSH